VTKRPTGGSSDLDRDFLPLLINKQLGSFIVSFPPPLLLACRVTQRSATRLVRLKGLPDFTPRSPDDAEICENDTTGIQKIC